MDGKADLILGLADDLDIDGCRRRGALASVAAIGERLGYEGERAARETQHDRRAVTVLYAGGLRLEDQPAPVGIHHDLALAALHLLARIVAGRTAALGGLDALAVEDDRVGDASRPTCSRSATTREWLMAWNRPLSRYVANQRNTVLFGGRSLGSRRQAIPPRKT